MQAKIKLGIIGIGMVGTPLMRWFLEKGFERGKALFCYDADPKKGYFDDVSKANILFICVPTPPNPDGSCNISIVESVVSQLPERENRLNWCIIIKSTVTPGTTAYLCRKYKTRGCFLFNPEFLTEAQAGVDFIRPDRQIIAAADEESRRWLNLVMNLLPIATYSSPGFFQSKDGRKKYHFHEVNSTEAELAKYGGNVFGAVKVAYSNIIADFCEIFGVPYENVGLLIGYDRRIGAAWMDTLHGKYRGFGGFCFPKDLAALIAHGEKRLKNLKCFDAKKKRAFFRAIGVLKAVWDYNKALLESQGLTIEEVSSHDDELKKKLEQKGGRS